jgi:predicted ester cyclase
MSTEENKALVRRFNEEAWNRRNPSVVDELFAPNYVAHMPGTPPLDREGHKHFIAGMQSAFADIQSVTEDLIADGDKVAWRWTFRGTQRGEFQGILPTGKHVTLTGISILRCKGGKVVESWHEIDTLGMMQQLGVIPAPAQTGAH